VPSETSIGINHAAAKELRLARLDMSAAERRQLTMSEVVRQLVQAWRTVTGPSEGRPAS
jgi:hypothetical protein